MKVLFVFNEVKNENVFVYTLRNALIDEGIEAKCSVDEFWHNYKNYDIIHFHWIIGHIQAINANVNDIDKVIEQINLIKLSQPKIVVTCHNLKPHYSTNKFSDILQQYIYEHCDAMIHLGQNSYDYLQIISSSTIKHYIIPHHIYNNFYQFSISKKEARKKLHISENANVLLCFGAFRHDEERKMVLEAWKKTNLPHKYLLTPGFIRVRRNIILGYKTFFKAMYYKLIGIHFCNKYIPHHDVETYFCAADVVMIQRCKILNSGNLTLGFLAKKAVIGPNVGNVGTILRDTGNAIFNPCEIKSITAAIQEGFRIKDTDLPQKNYEYGMENWNVSEIARKHIEVYSDILQSD
jgi:glycosyltransferase involved in cell wall biosynthesis